jgi:hypothetical protein
MTLVIEDTQERGPNGLPTISVAHYGEQNGDLMRDPEMIFEAEEFGEEMNLVPFYWRNDYVGIEQYSAFTEDGKTLLNAKLKREHIPRVLGHEPAKSSRLWFSTPDGRMLSRPYQSGKDVCEKRGH